MRKTNAEYSADWRERNPLGNREALAAYRLRHPDRVKAQKQRYYQRHKSKVIASNKRWREQNRERVNATERIASKKPERQRTHQICKWRRRYGLTPEKAEQLMASQNHACAICATSFSDIKILHVDHCHSSNVVRGFLCHLCNVGLGSFRDNLAFLSAAVKYLARFS